MEVAYHGTLAWLSLGKEWVIYTTCLLAHSLSVFVAAADRVLPWVCLTPKAIKNTALACAFRGGGVPQPDPPRAREEARESKWKQRVVSPVPAPSKRLLFPRFLFLFSFFPQFFLLESVQPV